MQLEDDGIQPPRLLVSWQTGQRHPDVIDIDDQFPVCQIVCYPFMLTGKRRPIDQEDFLPLISELIVNKIVAPMVNEPDQLRVQGNHGIVDVLFCQEDCVVTDGIIAFCDRLSAMPADQIIMERSWQCGLFKYC